MDSTFRGGAKLTRPNFYIQIAKNSATARTTDKQGEANQCVGRSPVGRLHPGVRVHNGRRLLRSRRPTLLLVGCETVTDTSSLILPASANLEVEAGPTLRSAEIRYETAVSQHGVSGDGRQARRLLAIRYPHPNGRLDVARAEIVFADTAPGETAPQESVSSSVTRFSCRAITGR